MAGGRKPSGKKKPTRQPSLLRKPVIEVKGKLGKAQKSKKRKIKKIGNSSVDFYEESRLDSREQKKQQQQQLAAVSTSADGSRSERRTLNTAPKRLEQEIPKKVRALIKYKQQAAEDAKLSKKERKAAQSEKFRKQQESTDAWFNRPVAATPKFERKGGENDRAYYSRVERESNEFMQIAKFENENECKVVEDEKGQIKVEKRIRRRQIKNKEFRDKKKMEKLQRSMEDDEHKDFSDLQDHVGFNERIDRPPEVLARPRKAKEKTSKSEKLSSLKFMGLIGPQSTGNSTKTDPLKSWAYKERMQEERQRAIDLYRDIKAKKRTNQLT